MTTLSVIYARKPADWHEIESGSRPGSGEAHPTRVIETKEMTNAEYDAFIADPLAIHEWMANKGGWDHNKVRLAIAFTAPFRETLYVDPSGANYARYVGRAVSTDSPKYPHVHVQLTGQNGNVFNLLGLCVRAGRKAGLAQEEIDAFFDEATSGDYNKALATCQNWFDCH